ncbi:zinc finger C3HC-type protein 1-like [Glandiceps talaboti]
MAEKSSVLATPKRIKALLSSFLHKEETQKDGETDRNQEETVQETSRSFQPRNREAYFARVETFSISFIIMFHASFTWFAKPVEISPLRCAQYGWQNLETDVLKCVSCKEIVCATLPNAWESELYAKRFEDLKAALSKAHSNICAWSDSPSPDFFLSIPLLSQSEAQKDFKTRSLALAQLKHKLPKLETCSIESKITTETIEGVIQMLLKLLEDDSDSDVTNQQEHNEDTSVHTVACLLALCGWFTSSSESSSFPILSCQYCRRQVGVWNFNQLQSKSSIEDDSGVVVDSSVQTKTDEKTEPMTKKRKLDIPKDAFNPITEHRSWCPWVISYSAVLKPTQTSESPVVDTAAMAGWKALLGFLAPSTSPNKESMQRLTDKQQTPPNQAWKAVRKLLKFWQSDSKQT